MRPLRPSTSSSSTSQRSVLIPFDELAGASIGEPIEIVADRDVDVHLARYQIDRDLKPQRRHGVLLDLFDELGAGEGLVLVNDHDPKPLYHQFEAEAGPEFRWEYRQKEPGEFRVLIGRADADDSDVPPSREPAGGTPESPF